MMEIKKKHQQKIEKEILKTIVETKMNIGAHCSYHECNREDFLPFVCKHCRKPYCLDHRQPQNHFCEAVHIPLQKVRVKIRKYPCVVCQKNTQILSLCQFCNQNVCLAHRFQDLHPCEKKKEKKKWWHFCYK